MDHVALPLSLAIKMIKIMTSFSLKKNSQFFFHMYNFYMLQPEAEGRKATWLRRGDERAACTCQSEPARGCARHSAAPVSLISQPHLPETPGGPPEKKKKKRKV